MNKIQIKWQVTSIESFTKRWVFRYAIAPVALNSEAVETEFLVILTVGIYVFVYY